MARVEIINEGYAPFHIPVIDRHCQTFYKVYGDLDFGIPPLICVHGGPGVTHLTNLSLAALWVDYGIPVVLYDQVGCGQSTLLPETEGDASVWQVSLFVDELNNLIDHLDLRDKGYYLYGVSFGGYIVPAFASERPRGLLRLIIASGSASKPLAYQSFDQVRNQLPPEHQEALIEAHEAGDYEGPKCQSAMRYFVASYLFRADYIPDERIDAILKLLDNPVKRSLSGPSPFFPGGTNTNFSNIAKLHQIQVPTMIYNAQYDTNGLDIAQKPFFELIPDVRWYTFAGVGHAVFSHSPETTARALRLLRDFLDPPVMK